MPHSPTRGGTTGRPPLLRVGSDSRQLNRHRGDPFGYSFSNPDIYTLQGAGSFSVQKRILDLAKRQNETAKNEKESKKGRRRDR